ncbi:hypothetical protein OSB04_027392 [Centaurea solstitialis]|uniref:Uncharacterized protein n=1 Tax=Centaurea solstitialis TaxID=347529 RepID=A0AA38SS09_9ASTR|nr:hypothetical protein OSB04_027392 [Centaurea solstitialis]
MEKAVVNNRLVGSISNQRFGFILMKGERFWVFWIFSVQLQSSKWGTMGAPQKALPRICFYRGWGTGVGSYENDVNLRKCEDDSQLHIFGYDGQVHEGLTRFVRVKMIKGGDLVKAVFIDRMNNCITLSRLFIDEEFIFPKDFNRVSDFQNTDDEIDQSSTSSSSSNNHSIEEIPLQYIEKRWQKNLISSEILKKHHWDREGNGCLVNDMDKFEDFVSKMEDLKRNLEASGCRVPCRNT